MDRLPTTPPTRLPGDRSGTGEWVEDALLAGPDDEVCLELSTAIDRAALRAEVDARRTWLSAAGLVSGGTVALRLPPSLAYITTLLAAWRIGAQVTLVDHRLAPAEVAAALERVGAQYVVAPRDSRSTPLRGFVAVDAVITERAGRPAGTPHALIQLSSGSTGPSKVIGRTSADLLEEVERYVRLDGTAQAGERIVLLASMVHVLGLVGGLLYGLHARVRLCPPERMTVDGVLAKIAADPTPTTVLGVAAHVDLLASAVPAAPLPQFRRMTTGGELVRAELRQRFAHHYGAVLANMYGMTEVGVIATDLAGAHPPALRPAPGIEVRVVDGELHVARPASPYVGLSDEARWSDGWLRTRDAASLDPATGLVIIRGRLDSQVSIGGLKVDLTEVEQGVAGLPGVTEAVVVFDGAIEAFVAMAVPVSGNELDDLLDEQLAAYKRPMRWHVVRRLPRTASGKIVRDHRVLREAAQGGGA